MRKILLVLLILLSIGKGLTSVNAQTSQEFYQLYKGGEKFLKPSVYLRLSDSTERLSLRDNGDLQFNVGKEIFIFVNQNEKPDTVCLEEYEKLKFINIKQLKDKEYEEYKRAVSKSQVHTPPPLTHGNLNIHFVEVLESKKAVIYKVKWLDITP